MKAVYPLLFLVLALQSLYPENSRISLDRHLDWREGALIIDARMDLGSAPLVPTTRYQAEVEIARELPALFMDSVVDITLNSLNTVGERIKEREDLYRNLHNLASEGKKQFANLSRDVRQVHVRYYFSFFGEKGLITPFIEHSRAFPIKKYLGFEPSRTFTGLVIFAQGLYPAHGKRGSERITPSLFLKLYDEDMNLILSSEMCEPETLMKWGMAAYIDSVDYKENYERIGAFPLKTMARGVFGKNSTDILIPNDIARKLLCREGNHKLLKQGRILIIID